MLTAEIENIIKSKRHKIIIGGKPQLKLPMETLLKMNSEKDIVTVPDNLSNHATAFGSVKIYECFLKNKNII